MSLRIRGEARISRAQYEPLRNAYVWRDGSWIAAEVWQRFRLSRMRFQYLRKKRGWK